MVVEAHLRILCCTLKLHVFIDQRRIRVAHGHSGFTLEMSGTDIQRMSHARQHCGMRQRRDHGDASGIAVDIFSIVVDSATQSDVCSLIRRSDRRRASIGVTIGCTDGISFHLIRVSLVRRCNRRLSSIRVGLVSSTVGCISSSKVRADYCLPGIRVRIGGSYRISFCLIRVGLVRRRNRCLSSIRVGLVSSTVGCVSSSKVRTDY